jgi:hypothetical protein
MRTYNTGLVRGASEGAGLGNQFLGNIRQVSVISKIYVYMCMYVCVYIYIHTYTYTYIYTKKHPPGVSHQ